MALVPSSKTLRETELVPLAKEIRRLADLVNNEKRDFSAEEKQAWEKVNADYETTRARCEALERASTIETALATSTDGSTGREDFNGKQRETGKVKPTEEDRALALQAWCRVQEGRNLKDKHKRAAKLCKVDPYKRHIDIKLPKNYRQTRSMAKAYLRQEEARALGVNINTAGGYLVPEGFVNNLEIALLQYGGILEVADVMRTTTGQDLPWPTVNDTTNKGSLITENTTVSELDTTFGMVVFHAFKYTSGMVQVPAELLEDSAFNLAMELGGLLGIRLGRIFADHFTFGTGASQPTGIQTQATLGITTASPTAIAADELYKLIHSIDPAYRKDPSFGLMCHDQILLVIKLLKDGAGRYLWQSGLANGAPDTIDGNRLTINQSMSNAAASTNITVLAGAFGKFKVRWVNQMRMRRLVERYADSDQEGFVGFMRADSNLLDAGTHPVKYLQQHV